jgi:hypothetical protein
LGWNELFLDLHPKRGLKAGQRWLEASKAATNRLRAEKRAGELLAEMKKNKGARGTWSNQHQVRLYDATAPQPPKLSDLGGTKSQPSRWQQLAALPKKKQERRSRRRRRRQRHSEGNVVSQAKAKSATPIATPIPAIDRMLTMPASQATSRNSDSMA